MVMGQKRKKRLLSKMVTIEGKRLQGGEHKRPMPTLTCEKCQYTVVEMRETSPCIKHVPDGINKVGQEKMKNIFLPVLNVIMKLSGLVAPNDSMQGLRGIG
jgi:hypothetical protein